MSYSHLFNSWHPLPYGSQTRPETVRYIDVTHLMRDCFVVDENISMFTPARSFSKSSVVRDEKVRWSGRVSSVGPITLNYSPLDGARCWESIKAVASVMSCCWYSTYSSDGDGFRLMPRETWVVDWEGMVGDASWGCWFSATRILLRFQRNNCCGNGF